jgi:hypothetical protein
VFARTFLFLLLCAWLKLDPNKTAGTKQKTKQKQKEEKPGYGEGWEIRL